MLQQRSLAELKQGKLQFTDFAFGPPGHPWDTVNSHKMFILNVPAVCPLTNNFTFSLLISVFTIQYPHIWFLWLSFSTQSAQVRLGDDHPLCSIIKKL